MEDKTKKILLYGLGAVAFAITAYYFYNKYKAITPGVTAENKKNRIVINKV